MMRTIKIAILTMILMMGTVTNFKINAAALPQEKPSIILDESEKDLALSTARAIFENNQELVVDYFERFIYRISNKYWGKTQKNTENKTMLLKLFYDIIIEELSHHFHDNALKSLQKPAGKIFAADYGLMLRIFELEEQIAKTTNEDEKTKLKEELKLELIRAHVQNFSHEQIVNDLIDSIKKDKKSYAQVIIKFLEQKYNKMTDVLTINKIIKTIEENVPDPINDTYLYTLANLSQHSKDLFKLRKR